MNQGIRKAGIVVVALAGMMGGSPLQAELPSFTEKEWLGYFVGFETNNYRFGITAQGDAAIRMLGKKGEPLSEKMAIPIQFLVEETLPDGRMVAKAVIPESLESTQTPTNKVKNVVIRGKVTGDAKFEVTVNEDRGILSMGGRILEPGTLKNPLKFSLRIKFGDAYPNQKAALDKKEQKALDDKTKDDRIQLSWTDGKRVKQSTTESVDAGSAEVNGPGIAGAQIEFSSYQDHKVLATATAPAAMKLANTRPAPLQEGFTLTWASDPAKDPEGKARLNVEVK